MIQMLVDGHIPNSGIEWLEGLLIFIGVAMVVISFIIAIRGINKSYKKDFEDRLNKERDDIKRSVVIDETLKDLRISVDNLSKSIYEMRTDITNKVKTIEERVICHEKDIVRIDQSVRSFHKRMDEHRRVDHGKNGSVRSEEEHIKED